MRTGGFRWQVGRSFMGGLFLLGCSTSDGGLQTSTGGSGHAGARGTLGGATGTGATSANGGGGGNHAGGSANLGGQGTPAGGTTGNGGTGNGGTGTGGTAPLDGGSSADAGSPDAGRADGPPLICPDGSFDHDGNPSNPCKAWSRCPPGQYIATEGTDTRDRVCALCGTGTYTNTQNAHACTPWTDCLDNTYLTKAGSTTADQKCSACPSAQSSQANQSTCLPVGACLFSGACRPGTVQVASGNATAPAQCGACGAGDYCAGGLTPQVRCESGTWDHDGDPATCCSPWAACAAGQYISKAGNAATNRECKSCATGTFSQYPNADKCSPWRECPSASTAWPQGGIATAGTAMSDVGCNDPYDRFGAPGASDGAAAVAVDSSGNVYVAGRTNGAVGGANAGEGDAFIRKLDAHGSILWTRQFGTSGEDYASGVGVDNSGNVYVTGSTYGVLQGTSAGSVDAFVRKLDPSGTTLWTQQFGSPGPDSARALAVDGSGNSYVAGSTYPTGNQNSGDPFVRKLDPSGTTLWNREFGGSDEDEASAVAVDGSGNVYVGGYTFGLVPTSSKGMRDAFVRKLNASGTTLWTQQFGSSDNDYVSAMSADSSGNIYVAGMTEGVLGGASAGSDDAFVRKLDPSGATLWTQQIGTPGYDDCSGLGMDGKGNVYVVGSTDGAFGGSNAGSRDVYVRKLDPSGASLWTKEIGTAADDSAQGAVADAAGNVYIVGGKGDPLNTNGGEAFVLYVPAQ